MKLNKKKRDRLNEYWEMLQFNSDCISYFKEGEPQYFCNIIEEMVKFGTYHSKHKGMLNKLERVYQLINKNKLKKLFELTKKFTK